MTHHDVKQTIKGAKSQKNSNDEQTDMTALFEKNKMAERTEQNLRKSLIYIDVIARLRRIYARKYGGQLTGKNGCVDSHSLTILRFWEIE